MNGTRSIASYSLLALCAASGEPILISDVLQMAPDLFDGDLAVQTAAAQALDLVCGDGMQAGYAFRDPAQQAALVNSFKTAGEWAGWQQRFLDYGQRVLSGLRSGQMDPRQAPTCMVRGYGKALEVARAPLSTWTGLLCRPWAEAWEWLGQPEGFQADTLHVFDQAAVNPANLGVQVLAALCHASVSFWDPIPGKVLAQALKKGVISQPQALALIPQSSWDEELRVESLAAIYPLLSDPFATQVSAKLEDFDLEAWEEETFLVSPPPVNRLSLADAEQQLAYFEKSSAETGRMDERFDAISDLLEQLPDSLLERGIDLWVKETHSDWSFPTAIIPRLPDSLVAMVLSIGMSLRFSSNFRAADHGVQVVDGLLDRLTPEQLRDLIEAHRFTFLRSSASTMVSGLPDAAVRAILEELQTARRDAAYAEAIGEIQHLLRRREEKGNQPAVPVEKPRETAQPAAYPNLAAALAEARMIESPSGRISALAKLAAELTEIDRRQVVEEALALLPDLKDSKQIADAIVQLAPLVSPVQAELLLDLARNLPVEQLEFESYGMWSRSETCLALAACFPGDRRQKIQEEAIWLARQESSSFRRAFIFNHFIPNLPVELRYGILEGIWELDYASPDYSTWSNVSYMMEHLTLDWEAMCQAAGADSMEALNRTLRAFAHAPRWLLCLSLEHLLPLIYRMGGTRAVIDAVRAALDVGDWWP